MDFPPTVVNLSSLYTRIGTCLFLYDVLLSSKLNSGRVFCITSQETQHSFDSLQMVMIWRNGSQISEFHLPDLT